MTQQEKFIQQIAPFCQKYAKQYGFKICSAAIGQACLESGYGTSYKSKFNNYFGLKYRQNRVNCNNGYFEDGGSEQNPDGTYTKLPSTTAWYSFDNMDKGVEGYYQFINIPYYAKVKETNTPLEYLQEIKKVNYATSLNYVEKVYEVVNKYNLTQYDNAETGSSPAPAYSNSPLVDCEVKSPNHSGKRTHSIDRITPHCVVGQLTAENIGYCFPAGRQASCNYGIGTEGRVCLIVDEENRSWCSSSSANDQRAITIECASDKTTPYAFNDAVYNKLIDLCTDICKRYGKTKLLWIDDKNTALSYEPKSNEMILTVHRWFANKSCPGDWMMARMGDLATKVTQRLCGGSVIPTPTPVPTPTPAPANKYPFLPFLVKVLIPNLNIRKTPNGEKTGKYTKVGIFTIVEISGNWGKLKSGAGWIYLANNKYTQILGPVVPFLFRITVDTLNIRTGPGANYDKIGAIINKKKYTIVETQGNWGLLKAYQQKRNGWINMSYIEKVE